MDRRDEVGPDNAFSWIYLEAERLKSVTSTVERGIGQPKDRQPVFDDIWEMRGYGSGYAALCADAVEWVINGRYVADRLSDDDRNELRQVALKLRKDDARLVDWDEYDPQMPRKPDEPVWGYEDDAGKALVEVYRALATVIRKVDPILD